jgi:DNA-binding Xre family transcriptional regulator
VLINLTLSVPSFQQHNFSLKQGQLRREQDPSWDVEEALRSFGGYIPGLIETLSYTLSPVCCASFIKANPELPISDRDYFLSKLFQFFYQSLLDEGDDPAHWDGARETLERLLDIAFPETASNRCAELSTLDWARLFRDYRARDLEGLVTTIDTYLPAPTSPPSLSPVQRLSPAQVIDKLREQRGWTLDQLAAEAGVDRKQVYAVKNEMGVHTNSLKKIARALGCDPGDLLTK